MKLKATVSIDENRNNLWLRFNKTDADNKSLIQDRGQAEVHDEPVSLKGSVLKFRFWWNSKTNPPYLEAEAAKGWSYNEAYLEVQRISQLHLEHRDTVTFNVSGTAGNYVLNV